MQSPERNCSKRATIKTGFYDLKIEKENEKVRNYYGAIMGREVYEGNGQAGVSV